MGGLKAPIEGEGEVGRVSQGFDDKVEDEKKLEEEKRNDEEEEGIGVDEGDWEGGGHTLSYYPLLSL